jgi:hypothetical protein
LLKGYPEEKIKDEIREMMEEWSTFGETAYRVLKSEVMLAPKWTLREGLRILNGRDWGFWRNFTGILEVEGFSRNL